MNLKQRIDTMRPGPTVARSLMLGLYDALADALVIPNELLPPKMRQTKQFDIGTLGSFDGKTYGRTVKEIEKMI